MFIRAVQKGHIKGIGLRQDKMTHCWCNVYANVYPLFGMAHEDGFLADFRARDIVFGSGERRRIQGPGKNSEESAF